MISSLIYVNQHTDHFSYVLFLITYQPSADQHKLVMTPLLLITQTLDTPFVYLQVKMSYCAATNYKP